jgi:hypothetical protein
MTNQWRTLVAKLMNCHLIFAAIRCNHLLVYSDMEALFRILYISTAARPLSDSELRDLLRGSHERNERAGITGMLLYKDEAFMQLLEGPEPAVKTLFEKISKDARHHGVIALLEGPVDCRQFPTSLMAFRDLGRGAAHLPGYSEFLNTPLNGDLFKKDLTKCQRLLLLFKQNVR